MRRSAWILVLVIVAAAALAVAGAAGTAALLRSRGVVPVSSAPTLQATPLPGNGGQNNDPDNSGRGMAPGPHMFRGPGMGQPGDRMMPRFPGRMPEMPFGRNGRQQRPDNRWPGW